MRTGHKKYKFVVVTQSWDSKSNGIRILYNLSSLIKELGYECFLYIWNSSNETDIPDEYKERIIANIDYKDDSIIVILPDAIPYLVSKQIKCKNRVWYLLNKPMVLTKEPIHIEPNDLFVSYSRLVNEYDYQAFYNSKIEGVEEIIEKVKKGELKKKNQVALYSGKARRVSSYKLFILSKILGAKIIPITRSIPENKKALLKVLAESKLLISFDPLSNIIYESTLCKTPVYIPDNYVGAEYEKYNIPLFAISTKYNSIYKNYRKGIPDGVYKKILDVYYQSTNNHLLETERFIGYILENVTINAFCNSERELNSKRSSIFKNEFENLAKRDFLINHNLVNYAPVLSEKVFLQLILLRCFKFFTNVLILLLRIDFAFANEIRAKMYVQKCNILTRHIKEMY